MTHRRPLHAAALIGSALALLACDDGQIEGSPCAAPCATDIDAADADATSDDAAPDTTDAPDDADGLTPDASACGDGACADDEGCMSCEADCGACPVECGDGVCADVEGCTSCEADCGSCPAECGDGACTEAEDCASCEADCGSCPAACGDGACDASERCESCAEDCGACPAACGDGGCEGGESCWSCAADCGPCDCPTTAQVVIYTQSAWNVLANALAATPSRCADYYISIPAPATDKTMPRGGGEAERMRARGLRFHAMAELHWGTWANVPGPWYDKGVLFRERMEAAGYDVAAGDTWAINELPSSVRREAGVRQSVRDLIRGLHDGPPGAPKARGAVFIVGLGQGTVNFSVYRPNLKTWLQEGAFWRDMAPRVAWWGQEVYTDPDYVCVDGAVTGLRAQHINAFTEHVATLAAAGPAAAGDARRFFDDAWTPLLGAVWNSEGSGYGDTVIPLDAMKHHVSTQVYATRVWADAHAWPDGRIGFAWGRVGDATDAQLTELAERLAASLRDAWREGGGEASRACSPSGAFTWCQCRVSGAAFNPGWSTFSTW